MQKLLIVAIAVLLSACGGGSGESGSSSSSSCLTCSTGSSIPVGGFAGTAFDGLIINGTVKVYDFTTGSQGELLGQATTDGLGLYSLPLQVETRPVLIEITGGFYVEESDNTNIPLTADHKLTALVNYTTGSTLKVAVTTYSHIAAGLAQYLIKTGTPATTAINLANQRLSGLAGINILTTTPKEITNLTNASGTLTPELKYGFLAGAISYWTHNHAPSGITPHLAPFSSIDFAQLAYHDISVDGLLDGMGVDSTGATQQLSFGTTLLGPHVYRVGLGTALVQMAAHPNNKTGLDGTKVLPFAQTYIANADPIFNNIAPVAFANPTVAITSPATGAWVRKSVNIVPSLGGPFDFTKVELLVDGVVASTVNGRTDSLPLNTALYNDAAHVIAVRVTDIAGHTAISSSISPKVDNTPPSVRFTGNYNLYGMAGTEGEATDAYSGPLSVTNLTTGFTSSICYLSATVTFCGFFDGSNFNLPVNLGTLAPGLSTGHVVRVADVAGNCSDYTITAIGAPGGVPQFTTVAGTCP